MILRNSAIRCSRPPTPTRLWRSSTRPADRPAVHRRGPAGQEGRVLADAAAELRPGLKVLFTTGYSRNAIVHQGRLDAGVQLITKPFTFEQLATRVRGPLENARRSPLGAPA